MSSSNSNMPGGFSDGNENPYRAKNLDPRVDGGRSVPSSSTTTTTTTTTTTSTLPSSSRDSGSRSGIGSGAATSGASQGLDRGYNTSSVPSTSASSTVMNTADPTSRSGEYRDSVNTKMPTNTASQGYSDNTQYPTHSTGATGTHETPRTADPATSSGTEEPGMMSRMLGAVGLGGAAAASSSPSTGYGNTADHHTSSSAIDSSTHSTGNASRSEPFGGPPEHYRRESIPTSAYPGGVGSPAAINAPIGGTRPSQSSTSNTGHHTNLGRDVGMASGAGAGAGAGIVGAHEYDRARELRENTTGQYPSTAAPSSGFGLGSSTSGVPQSAYDQSATTRGNVVSGASGMTSSAPVASSSATPAAGVTGNTFHDLTTRPSGPEETNSSRHLGLAGATTGVAVPTTSSSNMPIGTAVSSYDNEPHHHTGRNAALGAGAGAAAVGGAAYAVDDRSHQKEVEREERRQQKELEKEEKHHQKALAKEEKREQKEFDAATHRDQARLAAEEESRKREQREAAAGVGAGAFTGTGMTAHERAHHGHNDTSATSVAGPAAAGTAAATTGQHHHQQHHHAGTSVAGPAAAGTALGASGLATKADDSFTGRLPGEARESPNVLAGGQELATGMAGPMHTRGVAHDAVDPQVARDHARRLAEEETRARHAREAGAGVGTGAFTGTGMLAHERQHHTHDTTVPTPGDGGHVGAASHHGTGLATGTAVGAGTAAAVAHHPRASTENRGRTSMEASTSSSATKQKKPSILRRIFKRRKNQQTGEEEEYSTDEEDMAKHGHGHHTGTAAAATAATAAAAGTGAATHHHDHAQTGSSVPTHHSEDKGRTVLGHGGSHGQQKYEEVSGGATKPSYNPFRAGAEPAVVEDRSGQGPTMAEAGEVRSGTGLTQGPGTHYSSHPTTHAGSTATAGGAAGTGPIGASGARDSTYSGSQYSADTSNVGGTQYSGIHGPTSGAGERLDDGRYRESITGLPYDASKDHDAAGRLRAHDTGAATSDLTGGRGTDSAPGGSGSMMNRGRGQY